MGVEDCVYLWLSFCEVKPEEEMTDKITNKITKIVLTGGPCAGKTTAMAQIIVDYVKRRLSI